MKSSRINGSDGRCPEIGPNGPFGYSFFVWRRLQHGQEKIERFNKYFPRFGHLIHHQTGHEHQCSVTFSVDYWMILMRPYVRLDELLLSRDFRSHDISEGITGEDKPGVTKTDKDDRREYLVFEKLMKPLGNEYWKEAQRAFLLQFCLKNPECFPEDARVVMADLAAGNREEALFREGIQEFDYFYSAYEFWVESGVHEILYDVARHYMESLDAIAAELNGFKEVVWTPERRAFFVEFIKSVKKQEKGR